MRNYFKNTLGNLTVIALLMTILSVFGNVVLRYVFNNSLIALQELQWHFFATLFLLGMSYTLLEDAHVRVDVFYQKYSTIKRHLTNILGVIVFIIPISFIVAYYAFGFAYDAFLLGEQSGDPGGLSYRFIIKSIIPLSFILLIIASIDFTYQSWCGIQKELSKRILK